MRPADRSIGGEMIGLLATVMLSPTCYKPFLVSVGEGLPTTGRLQPSDDL